MAPCFWLGGPKKKRQLFSQKNWTEKKAGANGRVNPRIHYTSVPTDFLLQHSITPDS